MDRVETWLKRLLLAALFNTALWFSGVGCLVQVVLMVSIIGIPLALFMHVSPTIVLYLLPVLPIWLLLRGRSWALAAGLCLPVLAAIGWLVPMLANRRVEAQQTALAGRDHGGPFRLLVGSRVALLANGDGSQPDDLCADLCQRLLFSGVASMVLVGEIGALDGRTQPTAYFIAPNRGRCRPPDLRAERAKTSDLGEEVPHMQRPMLSSRLAEVYGAGHCLFAEPKALAEADFVLVDNRPDWWAAGKASRFGEVNWRFVRVDLLHQARVLRREQGRMVEQARRTWSRAHILALPLWLEPPSGDDSGSRDGHWGWSTVRETGNNPVMWASDFVGNRLDVGGLVGASGHVYRPEAAAKLTGNET